MTDIFYDPTGFEVPGVTEAQIREIDRVAIEETGPNLFQMMENAGRSLALTALDKLDPAVPGPIVVLAGTGGNGGGGIAAARHLANRGLEVIVAVTDQSRLGEVPSFQLHTFSATAGRVISSGDLGTVDPVLIIDAVIGYRLRAAPSRVAAEMIVWAGRQSAPILSLDIPSGIDATTGDTPGLYITADTTMTLALPKTGLTNKAAGTLVLADVGIPAETYRRAGVVLRDNPFRDRFRLELSRSQPPTGTQKESS